jgi:predicted MFS family arabinose efflux permease
MPQKPILLVLALGAFAVGTDNFVINGVLPRIAGSMRVSEAIAGQLITLFALVYAISAPVLAVATAQWSRRAVLVTSMALFVAGNVLGAVAPQYWVILTARVLSALAAAMYMGPAMAAAAVLVPESFRGRALALVGGGLTVATALGVPSGTLIGNLGSWRLTLAMVAAIAGVAVVGIATALPAVPQPLAVSLADRLKVGARPPVFLGLLANVCTVAGTFTVFTYIAPLAVRETTIAGTGLTLVLLSWGLAAVVGNPIGGRYADRYGADRTLAVGLGAVSATLAGIGLLAVLTARTQPVSAVLLLLAVVALGVSSWSLPPAQLHRMVGLAPEAPPVVSSLNSSATYLGLALGGATGGLVLSAWSTAALGWVGAALQMAALGFVAASRRLQVAHVAAARSAAVEAGPSLTGTR